jgi:hypothetical protein
MGGRCEEGGGDKADVTARPPVRGYALAARTRPAVLGVLGPEEAGGPPPTFAREVQKWVGGG